MSNSIRTPKTGISATSRKIALAVDDEEWQRYRVSMKGTSTQEKLDALSWYYCADHAHEEMGEIEPMADSNCAICIRLDNYIKALCRGGLLYGGESLTTCVEAKWKIKIKRM